MPALGGVGPQDQVRVGRLDEEGVLHLPGRVVRANVQRVEVEPLGLDLGTPATSQPIATKTSAIRSEISSSGCRAPSGRRPTGTVTSTASSTRIRASRSASSTSVRAASAAAAAAFAAPIRARGGPLGARQVPIARFAPASGL